MMSHAYPSSRILRAYQICQKRQSGIKRVERRLTNLLHWHTSRKQLDKVARFEDCSWVKGFPSGLDRHATLDQVKSTGDSKLLQRSCDHGPCLFQVNLTVFGEKSGKGRFLCETPTDVVIGFEWFLLSQIFKLANENFLIFLFCVQRTFHLSMSSVSHGLSFLYVDGMLEGLRCSWTGEREWKTDSPNNFFSPPAAYPIGDVCGLINKAYIYDTARHHRLRFSIVE